MLPFFRSLAGLFCLGVTFLAFAGQPTAPDLKAQILKLPADEMTLKEILAELEKQTGNAVADLRAMPRANPRVALRPGTFWQTLDALGAKTGIGFTSHAPQGGVALVDTPYQQVKVGHRGVFRFSIKGITIARDDELQTHHAVVAVNVAWEPRVALMYLSLEQADVTVGQRTEKASGSGAQEVFGAGAAKIELRVPAPARAATRIDAVKGEIRVLGAPKMLEFTFDKLAPLNDKKPRATAPQEGVKVSVLEVKQLPGRWSIRLQIANPPGAISGLESHQHPYWTNNNRLWLTWTDPQTKRRVTLEPTGDSYTDAKDGRTFDFIFRPQGETPLPAKTAEVTLRYRTPNRVAAFTVPFAFQDLPLP